MTINNPLEEDPDLGKMSILRTKLSNERTYNAYIRTGLAVSVFSLPFKKYRLVSLGILMIICSTVEYYYITYNVNRGIDFKLGVFEFVPIITTVLILVIFYFELKDLKKQALFTY